MAKAQRRSEKGPKKADDTARQAKKLAGPKYLRGRATLMAADLRPNRPQAR